jgi:hypothetical protein
MDTEKKDCVAKIDLPFFAKGLALTTDMNLIAVTNG